MRKFYLNNKGIMTTEGYNDLLYYIGKAYVGDKEDTISVNKNRFWHFVTIGVCAVKKELNSQKYSKRMIKYCILLKGVNVDSKSCYYIKCTKQIYDALYKVVKKYNLEEYAKKRYLSLNKDVIVQYRTVVAVQAETVVNNQFSELKMPQQQLDYINKLADWCMKK